MANTQSMPGATRQRALAALVDGKTLKAALFLASASQSASVTDYATTGEVTGTGYPAGGVSVTNANAAALTGTTAYWTPSASIAFPSVTLATSFDCASIYDTANSKVLGHYTFTAQTVTAGTFTLTMPTNDATNALMRLG